MYRLTTGPHAIRALIGASVLCILVAVGSSPAAASGGVGATVINVVGQVEVVPPGKPTPIPARVDMRVEPGSKIRTKSNGFVELQFDDRSLLRLDHSSEVEVLAGEEARGVMVTLGKIWAKVQTVLGMSKFQIKTPVITAGVRGTIVRAEVDADGASIAVDEGEVEVADTDGEEDDELLILGQEQMVRRDRGVKMAMRAAAFNPEARQKWEHWTDPLVQQRIKGVEEAAGEAKRLTEDLHASAQNAFDALSVDMEAVKRIRQRVNAADAAVNSVKMALDQPQANMRRNPRMGGGRRPGGQQPQTKAQLLARLEQANATYAQCMPLVTRGRQAMTRHVEGLRGLRESFATQQIAIQTLHQRLEGFQRRREVDPHWAQFKGAWDRCQGRHHEIGQALGRSRPLLDENVPEQLSDDPTGLKAIQHCFVWGSHSLEQFEGRITAGQAEAQRLHGAIQGGGRIGR